MTNYFSNLSNDQVEDDLEKSLENDSLSLQPLMKSARAAARFARIQQCGRVELDALSIRTN